MFSTYCVITLLDKILRNILKLHIANLVPLRGHPHNKLVIKKNSNIRNLCFVIFQ